MQKLVSILFLLLVSTIANAQEDSVKASIKVLGRYKNNAVELRWVPTSASTWRIGNKSGYIIERMELGNDDAKAQRIAVVKPYQPKDWETKTDLQNDFVRATREAIMSVPNTPLANDDFDKMLKYQNDENGIFLTFVLCTNMNTQAVEAAGLKFIDKTIIKGKAYAYKISIPNSTREEDGSMIFINNTTTEAKSIAPKGLRLEEEEGAIKLFWNYKFNHTLFAAYYIERSEDGGKSFSSLNKIPLIFSAKDAQEISYIDSVKNYIPYQYRIKGITAFGDNSEVSEPIIGFGRDKTPAIPASNVRADGDRNKITVTWMLTNPSKDLKGFYIARSTSLNGPFTVLNEDIKGKDVRLFIDTKPSPKEPYYVVYTLDTAKNVSSAFAIMASVYDSVAPKQPLALTGKIDSLGVVTINWKYGTDNDLHGYNIYRANGKNDVYYQLTGYPLNDSTFSDTVTMRSLTKEVFYKITAVDYNNNPSLYSEIAELKRPDIIAPAAPVLYAYNVVANTVSINWAWSNSNDVIKHELVRKDAIGSIKVLATFTTTTNNNFIDSNVVEGETYAYELIAIDDAGLKTASTTLNITVAETSAKMGVDILEATVDEKTKEVLLSWKCNAKGSYSFMLLKNFPDGTIKPLRTLDNSTYGFTDSNIGVGKYAYAIKLLYADGTESLLSKPVLVEIK